ncbi:PPOX class F420-dependent oxidoreductase [Nocardia sp. NPDC050717]|uniref:PPOX class F420-dependent oxidoreductase n=1 Tax=Nocardia sp. NPDC050717 TaxID=3157221 RepID=UPI0033DF4A91
MEHPHAVLDDLAAGKYLLLTTFRRDGTPVPTPVWVMRDGPALVVCSAADAGKVKRIRKSGNVTISASDWRGRPRGAAVPAFAELLPPDATGNVIDLMKRKYGLAARIGLAGSALRGGAERMVGIRIRLDA